MPHKRNPVACERICGMARLLRGNAQVALENQALWHQRDISHSSAERVILPDSTIALDCMLREATRVISGLQVYPRNMLANLERTRGLLFSQQVMLALVGKGVSRQEAYKTVQKSAMWVWKQGGHLSERLLEDPKITQHLTRREVQKCFDLKPHLRHVNRIFKKVGLEDS
ncbi:MAG: adenylosuccinate lyase, partial [Candidatus Omnitrophica bacterium]|nr:adenylosuccinate lyase [Candidatus Omnitrophota bacterium]